MSISNEPVGSTGPTNTSTDGQAIHAMQLITITDNDQDESSEQRKPATRIQNQHNT